jgi:hypothetical protein
VQDIEDREKEGKMETPAGEYTVRRLRPEDAQGVVDCVRRVYGDSYIVHKELYDPAAIVALNDAGRLVSVVALHNGDEIVGDEIVGHYALERPDLTLRVVESGEAMVLPEHRHHYLLEKMRVLLEDEARRLGLIGIFGRTVTNHVFSQKMVERFGERPCGVSLGEAPRSFHAKAQALSQRMSIVFYFKYLGTVDAVRIHVPPRHHDICRQIYEQFEVRVEPQTSQAVPESGEVVVDHHAVLQQAVIMVRRVGKDTTERVRSAHRDLRRNQQVDAVYVELPLSEAGSRRSARRSRKRVSSSAAWLRCTSLRGTF